MAFIRMIDRHEARGELLDVYTAMASRPIPSVYVPSHGGAPGIHRAHSLDAALVRHVFGATGTMHAGEHLSWAERELIATVSSRLNQCLY
jgi:Carboxymuconolactone decarboxylase family